MNQNENIDPNTQNFRLGLAKVVAALSSQTTPRKKAGIDNLKQGVVLMKATVPRYTPEIQAQLKTNCDYVINWATQAENQSNGLIDKAFTDAIDGISKVLISNNLLEADGVWPTVISLGMQHIPTWAENAKSIGSINFTLPNIFNEINYLTSTTKSAIQSNVTAMQNLYNSKPKSYNDNGFITNVNAISTLLISMPGKKKNAA